MKSAFYGLLQVGRCWQYDDPSVGCYDNVITYFDEKCSGKRKCTIQGNVLTHLSTTCPDRVTPYLEATYTCLPGNYSI